MIQRISHRVSEYLVDHGADSTQKEVYAYSMECLLNLFISDFLLFSIGLFLHRFWELIIWCISYTLLRVNIGGYHASTHARCIISGTIVGLCSLPLNEIWFLFPQTIVVLFLLILLNITLLAPVPHPHHPVSAQGKKKAKIRAIIITLLGFLLVYVLRHYNNFIGSSLLSGFACALLLSFIGAAFNPKHSFA